MVLVVLVVSVVLVVLGQWTETRWLPETPEPSTAPHFPLQNITLLPKKKLLLKINTDLSSLGYNVQDIPSHISYVFSDNAT